jgi:uncharacterized protein DUF4124
MRIVLNWSLALVPVVVFFGSVALAQSIFQWKDEKGQSHFTDFPPPSGTTVIKIFEGTPSTESSSVSSDLQPDFSSSANSEDEQKPTLKLPTRSSNVSHAGSDTRWLLIFPPAVKPAKTNDTKQFSGWTPDKFFDSDEACNRYKALRINDQFVPVDSQLLNSECIPATEFTSGEDADVIIAATQFEPVVAGFSSHFVSGKVFNRGVTTAVNVIAKYQVRDSNGVTLTQGEVATTPSEIPGLAFGEFRTPSIGSWNLDGLSVQAEVSWSKK